MQKNHLPQTASSEHSQIQPQRGDPGLVSMLFPKAASGWVNGGQEWDPGGASAGWGLAVESHWLCPALPSSPSCSARNPPALLPDPPRH